eukprot:CAMPEP_0173178138 /NCGR_PEP_ID=MMETSP1141-20130122/5364_1 /TAXON_ID=483371 /ORGANISM="non described non described, Strain CCMP2298" /LENGTH=301 /DNA_ID=CAMNT_0014100585 /DNA_START=536 /DNA_END=1440 /DNA_ORIENTATION=-
MQSGGALQRDLSVLLLHLVQLDRISARISFFRSYGVTSSSTAAFFFLFSSRIFLLGSVLEQYFTSSLARRFSPWTAVDPGRRKKRPWPTTGLQDYTLQFIVDLLQVFLVAHAHRRLRAPDPERQHPATVQQHLLGIHAVVLNEYVEHAQHRVLALLAPLQADATEPRLPRALAAPSDSGPSSCSWMRTISFDISSNSSKRPCLYMLPPRACRAAARCSEISPCSSSTSCSSIRDRISARSSFFRSCGVRSSSTAAFFSLFSSRIFLFSSVLEEYFTSSSSAPSSCALLLANATLSRTLSSS